MEHRIPSAPGRRRRLRTAAITLSVVAVLVGSFGCGAGAATDAQLEPLRVESVEPGPALRIQQVDFVGAREEVRDTAWGRVLIDPAELAKATGIEGGWLNIATERGWVVVNLPLPPRGEPPFAVYFDLGIEQPQPVKRLTAFVRHSNRALGSLGNEMGDPVYHYLTDWVVSVRGRDPRERLDPGPPPPSLTLHTQLCAARELRYWLQGAPNEQCASNQCGTMATANALQRLEETHVIDISNDHRPGLRGDTTLVGMLDEYVGRRAVSRMDGGGVEFGEKIDGTLEYLSDVGLADLLEYRHQVVPGATSLPESDYTAHGVTSHNDGPVPTFEWIRDRLGEGSAVVAGYSIGIGGHAVRITAAFEDDAGNRWVRYAHDALQTDVDPTDTLGLENVVAQFGDLDDDGLPNIGAYGDEVLAVWALCP